jgi:hypothetical protein
VCQASHVIIFPSIDFQLCACVDAGVACGPGACSGPGVCPPDQICVTFASGGGECGCTPAFPTTTTTLVPPTTTTSTTLPAPCAGLPFPQCNGACPAGEYCAGDVGSSSCACFPVGVTACGDGTYPQCGGACLGGLACQAVRTIIPGPGIDVANCLCIDPEIPCGPNVCPVGPGVCPAGQACLGFATGGPVECNCVVP